MTSWFDCICDHVSDFIGSIYGFLVAVIAVLVWAIAGPFFDFSENWQLVINTGTTILTFLMLFLLQRSQNRGNAALHRKVDELIRGVPEADNSVVGIERR